VKIMPVVYVIASDWKMRTAVRAELHEMGVEGLGMDSADDVGRAIASGTATPSCIANQITIRLVYLL
jgi:hypothetical protein